MDRWGRSIFQNLSTKQKIFWLFQKAVLNFNEFYNGGGDKSRGISHRDRRKMRRGLSHRDQKIMPGGLHHCPHSLPHSLTHCSFACVESWDFFSFLFLFLFFNFLLAFCFHCFALFLGTDNWGLLPLLCLMSQRSSVVTHKAFYLGLKENRRAFNTWVLFF